MGDFFMITTITFIRQKRLLENLQKKHQMENLSPVSFVFEQVMIDPIGVLKMIGRKLYFYFNDLEGASNLSI